MSTVTATVPAVPGHGRADAAKADAPGFALLLGVVEETLPDDGPPGEGPAAEAKGETASLPPDPLTALVLPLPGIASAAAAIAAAPAADPDAAPATSLPAAPPATLARALATGDLPVPADTPAAGPAPVAHRGDGSAPRRDAAAAVAGGPRPAAMPGPDLAAARPDPASLSRNLSGAAGETMRPAQAAAVPFPIRVDDGPSTRVRPMEAASRPLRGPAVSGSSASPGESLAAGRPSDGVAPPPGLVAVADIRSEPPQSGPERTEPEPADAPAFALPEALAEAPGALGTDAPGHVQSARLSVGIADRLSITLAATTEASRALLERETPELASELAAAGAKVEAIRVDLAPRVNPDGRAEAAGGPHPGPGQGGGAPWDRGAQPERTAAPDPDAPAGLRTPGQSRAGLSDGGKVDRYA